MVAIDGKTAQRSYQRKDKLGAIHRVSAWASGVGLSLGLVKTTEKSNEITATPVLELLEIKGCIITIDAMGCQTDIAKKIVTTQPLLNPKDGLEKTRSMRSGYCDLVF